MSQVEEIPDDIRVTALEITYAFAMPDEEALDMATKTVASALLAERDRATRVQIGKDAAIAKTARNDPLSHQLKWWNDACIHISVAIRSQLTGG